jgi:penicillin-binding protein 2
LNLKRAFGLLLALIFTFAALMLRIAQEASPRGRLSQAAAAHGSYDVIVCSTRGTIYDRNMRPLVNASPAYYALVPAGGNIPRELTGLSPFVRDIPLLERRLASGMPFAAEVSSPQVNVPGVEILSGVRRYSDDTAPQLIGYLGSDGSGAAGLEKALDSELKIYKKTVSASYPVNAEGGKLEGLGAQITVSGDDAGGAVLTIDSGIQLVAQQAAETYLKSGAVVVMEPKSGDILACVSVPSFSPNRLAAAVKASGSPMINRAFAPFNLGSVFKISVAASALESGIDASFSFDCAGGACVSGRLISCADGEVHGREDMAKGFADSCNGYFVTLGAKTGPKALLSMARALGFGSGSEFWPGFSSSAGTLPDDSSLALPLATANFSIGEGRLLATPVQAARMVCAVADGGEMPTPRLVMRTVDASLRTKKQVPAAERDRVFSKETAELIKSFMIKTVREGTGTAAEPAAGGAGGKTGTAETGIPGGGGTVIQAWFAGFYPAQTPKYVIVVLRENGVSGGADAAPVFRYIADRLP